MPYSALSVANKLIALAHEAGRTIAPMQVIKLTYFCHAWMLGLHSRPLLDEPVEAWQYGPVIPKIYRSLRRYGGGPVTRQIPNVKEANFDAIELDLIEQVSSKYGRLTSPQLSALTTPLVRLGTKCGWGVRPASLIIASSISIMTKRAR